MYISISLEDVSFTKVGTVLSALFHCHTHKKVMGREAWGERALRIETAEFPCWALITSRHAACSNENTTELLHCVTGPSQKGLQR